jgi:tetratricopeptide (TPR) repeat protein
MRRYAEAECYYDRVISLAPDMPGAYSGKAGIYLRREGSTEKAREVVEEAIKSTQSPFIDLLIWLDIYDRNYQEALDRLSLKSDDVDSIWRFLPNALQCAQVYRYMNKDEPAKKYYDEARIILEAKVKDDPNDARFHSSLGIAYAGLGRKEDAIREGKAGVELLPISKDARGGPGRIADLAHIFVMVGELDAAIDQLEFLLTIPGVLSIPLLKLEPAWDPLRNHPRFKKLVEQSQ